jgi:hypothetical protein
MCLQQLQLFRQPALQATTTYSKVASDGVCHKCVLGFVMLTTHASHLTSSFS